MNLYGIYYYRTFAQACSLLPLFTLVIKWKHPMCPSTND